MNAAVAVFLFACVAAVAAADDASHAHMSGIKRECAIANNISREQLSAVRATADKASIAASDDLKCFTKCTIERSQFVHDGAVDVERVVAVAEAHNRDGAKVRANAGKCAVAAPFDCNAAWELYKCLHQ